MSFRASIGTRLLLITVGVIVVLVGSFAWVTARELEKEALDNLVHKARAITNEAENARQYVASLRGKHHAYDDQKLLADVQVAVAGARTPQEIIERARPTAFYASIPIVAAWTVAQTNAEKAGYRFKVPKIQPRNPANEPDALERELLEELSRTGAPELYRVDPQTNSLRYLKPVVLSAECLLCHGTVENYPAGKGKDPLGLAMEGWKEGEVHGGFEVIADLAPVQAHTREVVWQLVALAVAFLLGAVALLVLATRRLVTRPLATAVEALERVAEGDLTPRLEVAGEDEVSRLGRSLNAALDGVEETLAGVAVTANEMASASRELSSAAQHLSETAQQQAANMEQTNATLSTITEASGKSARDARETAGLARVAQERATEGGAVVGTAVDSINEARDASKQVVEIIETIDDIAAQTNLLALNATVEAARAGQHGRGFAVVANEVRELSLQTGQAAKRIHQLVDSSVSKVEAGAGFAGKSREALADIVGRVRDVTRVVDDIAGAAETQATGVAQVHQAMSRLDLLVQGTASQTEELAATSEALNANAARLHELVDRFQLTGHQRTAVAPAYQAPPSPPRTAPPARSAPPRPRASAQEFRAGLRPTAPRPPAPPPAF